MSGANIADLGNLADVETLDLDEYPDTGSFTMPTKGKYQVQAPDTFPEEAFGETKAGAMSVEVSPTLVARYEDGVAKPVTPLKLRFQRVSAKVFLRKGLKASQLGDYLRACGVRGKLASDEDRVNAVAQTANRLYDIILDWRAYNKNTGFSVEGMENFEPDGKGGFLPFVKDPNEKDGEGNPVRVPARLYIRNFLSARD